MSTRSGYGGCWPTRAQELLLKASIMQGVGAGEAFLGWKASADVNTVDPGSYRLFPLLSENLRSNGMDDPLMNIFRWVYERTLSNNRTLYERLSILLSQLNARSMPAMLIKGSALALLYYRDPGLRPMMDADILVPTARAREAMEIITALGWRSSVTPLKGIADTRLLTRLGWTPGERGLGDYTDEYFSVRHGQDFTNPSQFTIDLHWHLLHGHNLPGADDDFWEGARSMDVKGVPVLALDPADQLLQVCSHGVAWSSVPPVRWVADAAAIIRREGEGLDWERLSRAAERHGKTLPVRDALTYLETNLGPLVPERVLARLAAIHVTGSEKFDYGVRTKKPGVLAGFVELRFLWNSYSSENGDKNLIAKISGFPKFLEHVFGMDTAWQLALYSGYELVRRTGGFLRSVKKSVLGSRSSG